MEWDIFSDVDGYIETLFAAEDAVLVNARARIREAGLPDISITASQGKLLHVLCMACRASRVLEIGALGGYSTIWLGRALPPNGELTTIEIQEMAADVARQNTAAAGLGAKAHVTVGDAVDVMSRMVSAGTQPFDLIFIDADKAFYADYLELSLQLSHDGTLIVADNVVRGGAILDAHSPDARVRGVQRFNETLSRRSDVVSAVFQVVGAKGHDGMAVAVVRRGERV